MMLNTVGERMINSEAGMIEIIIANPETEKAAQDLKESLEFLEFLDEKFCEMWAKHGTSKDFKQFCDLIDMQEKTVLETIDEELEHLLKLIAKEMT